MKSPQKVSPFENEASSNTGTGDAPVLLAEGRAAQYIEEGGPIQAPPASSASSGAIGAGVWNNGKTVNGLYTTYHSRNAWMSIAGIGWQRLATSFDSANEAMTILASHARTKNSQINYSMDAGLVSEMYVW